MADTDPARKSIRSLISSPVMEVVPPSLMILEVREATPILFGGLQEGAGPDHE